MNNVNELTYVGTYKVIKIMRKSANHKTLYRGLTLERAKLIVNSFPDSNNHMICFQKEFTGEKHWKLVLNTL